MKTEERNKLVVQEYVAAFNRGDLNTLQNLVAPDGVIQGVLGKGHLDKVLHIWEQLITGLGMQLTIEEMIAAGDVVTVRYTERGTFKGPFLGHEPTGKSYELVALEWFQIQDGLIRQRWGARDHAAQARQIGLPLA
jgi:predicted ester cyclase